MRHLKQLLINSYLLLTAKNKAKVLIWIVYWPCLLQWTHTNWMRQKNCYLLRKLEFLYFTFSVTCWRAWLFNWGCNSSSWNTM